jgi:hypothetical protein
MRDIESLKTEIKDRRGTAKFYKWWAITLVVLGIYVGFSENNMMIFLAVLCGALLVIAAWSAEAGIIQRLEEEIQERDE